MLSRIIYGARISLTIGLLGITVSASFSASSSAGSPAIMAALSTLSCSASSRCCSRSPAFRCGWRWPRSCRSTWSPLLVYFGITIILGLLDWTGLARAVRSKLLALREEDYVLAAQLMGAKPPRIIGRHLIPGFMSHLIATATISIPGMILGETALSFLGFGLRPPITSWGVLLTEAQNINVVALYPWLMFPVIPVILVILAFNFLGDGLRDAADPYR